MKARAFVSSILSKTDLVKSDDRRLLRSLRFPRHSSGRPPRFPTIRYNFEIRTLSKGSIEESIETRFGLSH